MKKRRKVKENRKNKDYRGGTVSTRNWTPKMVTPEKGNILCM